MAIVKYQVIIGCHRWNVSGASVFAANLVRGLNAQGVPSSILFTRADIKEELMPFPADVPSDRLPVDGASRWSVQWKAMINYLEERTPCIYIPNADQFFSCVSPRLSNRVGIVGIVHSDDPWHYEHVSRLGKYWNAIVAVSETVARKTAELDPDFPNKLKVIHCGVSVPAGFSFKDPEPTSPLRIIYAGRLVQSQKRVLDLPRIAAMAIEQGLPVELTIVGDGPDRKQLEQACQPLIDRKVIRLLGVFANEDLPNLYQQNDVFILTSSFEGLPISLLEAMAHGLIPLVTRIESGVNEIIDPGQNGFMVEVGDLEAFVQRLAGLKNDLLLRKKMAENAYATVAGGGFTIQDMTRKYVSLFQWVMENISAGRWQRPPGQIIRPPALRHWKQRLPGPVVRAGVSGKRMLRKIGILPPGNQE